LELLVIVLNQVDVLTEILDQFVEQEIKGATVLDSAGMAHIIADHIPFFSQFANLDSGSKTHSKTIFTVVSCIDERNKAVRIVEDVIGDIAKSDTAFIFSIPVNFVKGITIKECGDKN